jgi:hypothetical protein
MCVFYRLPNDNIKDQNKVSFNFRRKHMLATWTSVRPLG